VRRTFVLVISPCQRVVLINWVNGALFLQLSSEFGPGQSSSEVEGAIFKNALLLGISFYTNATS